MSIRSQKNRRLLLQRIALLALCYALPLGGLALFFLMTGLNSGIAAGERERMGVQYITQVIRVHDGAVRTAWGWSTSAPTPDPEQELARLEVMEKKLDGTLRRPRARGARRGEDLTVAELRTAWQEAREASAGSPEQAEALTGLIEQLHALIAFAGDSSGLTLSPELETDYVTDVIAFALPIHLERLLQLHEQLRVVEAAGPNRSLSVGPLFSQLVDKEDLQRMARSTQLAIEGDANSAHRADGFQRDYPKAATAFLQSLGRLSAVLAPGNPDAVGADWDAILHSAYSAAVDFWRTSAEQLDVLLRDQVAQARTERNTAIGITAAVILGLLPLTWLYFRTSVRPLVQDLVNEVREAADMAAKAKSRFLAMISHEIRTPMNGVIGFTHLLGETSLDAQQREFVRTIAASGESLLTVINDLLDFSKLEAERTELELRPLAVRSLVEDVFTLLSAAAAAKRLDLIYAIEEGVPASIMGDETRLRQILLNLVGNALKFTTAGHVEVAVQSAAPLGPGAARITFHVRDTGMGIPHDRLDRLFKPFSQVDPSISRTHGGTGLGLAISQRLVALMGGEIGITSEPGRGSDFYFTVPAPAAESAAGGAAPRPQLGGKRILLVGAYPPHLRRLEEILASHGATVAAAAEAEPALAAIAVQPFDLAIIDDRSPALTGPALAAKIHDTGGKPHLPLILVAFAPPAEAAPGLFAAVIKKPVRNREFAWTVMRVLAGEPEPAPTGKIPPAGENPSQFAIRHPLRILAVDDNAVNLRVIAMTLASLGYAPIVVNTARAALDRLRGEKVDLVLMDVQMADMDGREATRRLRRGEAGGLNQHTRVWALTAGATKEEQEACQSAGMEGFIAKPITPKVLIEKLAAIGREEG